MGYDLLIIGTSAGGIEALKVLLPRLQWPIGIPVIIVQHLQPQSKSYLPEIISRLTGMQTYEVEDKMEIDINTNYTPAPNYHLMMEKDWTFSLSAGERVSYARPSIDVAFETVADAVKGRSIGVILTGANNDGADGLAAIKANGGYTIVQTPQEAYASTMTHAAIEKVDPDDVLPLVDIGDKINELLRLK